MADSQISRKSAKLTVEILSGSHKGSVRTFSQESISIGRSSENDLSFTEDAKMSRKHARILMTPDGFEIENITDKNLLYVDGIPTKRERMKPAQKIVLGQTELSISFDAIETQAPSVIHTIGSQASLAQSVSTELKNPLPPPPPVPKTTKALQQTQPGVMENRISTSPAPVPAIITSVKAPTPQSFQQSMYPPSAQPPFPQPPFPQPGNRGYQNVSRSVNSGGSGLKVALIVVIAAVGVYFTMFDKSSKRAPASTDVYRTSDAIQNDRDKVKKSLDELEKQDTKLESLQFKRAQENLDKGLRDYRNGQYSLARDKFLLVLSLDPQNQTARRYEQLSRFKLDEQIKYYSLQGRKYYERQNFRLCVASFEKVIILVQKKDDKQFQEAAEFLRLCQQSMNTRYE